MTDSTWLFIQCCWGAWVLYWVVMAFATKRTVERGGFLGYRLVAGILIVGMLAAGRLLHVSSNEQLWQTPLGLGVVTDSIVLAGAAFTVWARITLIESGPYALARHPIYTGLIVMALGTAINYGHVLGFGLLVALCGGLWWKARQEEGVMSRHFPGAYADYKTRVHAIIPFVL
jgi:protein-S-isoprenylcysteine O-methyltransferase Ste14